jgi:hypothetical protein
VIRVTPLALVTNCIGSLNRPEIRARGDSSLSGGVRCNQFYDKIIKTDSTEHNHELISISVIIKNIYETINIIHCDTATLSKLCRDNPLFVMLLNVSANV